MLRRKPSFDASRYTLKSRPPNRHLASCLRSSELPRSSLGRVRIVEPEAAPQRSASPAPPARQGSLAIDTPVRQGSLAIDTPVRQGSLVRPAMVARAAEPADMVKAPAVDAEPAPSTGRNAPATPVRQSSLESDAVHTIAVESSPDEVVTQLVPAPSPEWSPPSGPTLPTDAPVEHLDLGLLGIAPSRPPQFIVPARSSSAVFA